jgi:hypothetical protein
MIARLLPTSRQMLTLQELRATAYHEAGHAVYKTVHRMPMTKVTIVPNEARRTYGKVHAPRLLGLGDPMPATLTRAVRSPDQAVQEATLELMTKELRRRLHRRNRLIPLMVGDGFAGMAAEAEYVRRSHVGSVTEVWSEFGNGSDDWAKASIAAEKLFPTFAADPQVRRAMFARLDGERRKIKAQTREPEYWAKVSSLAEALLVRGTLSAREARAIIGISKKT